MAMIAAAAMLALNVAAEDKKEAPKKEGKKDKKGKDDKKSK